MPPENATGWMNKASKGHNLVKNCSMVKPVIYAHFPLVMIIPINFQLMSFSSIGVLVRTNFTQKMTIKGHNSAKNNLSGNS